MQFKSRSSTLTNALAFVLMAVVVYYSGWREVGIDREGYISNYKAVTSATEFLEKIFFAKDLLFLIIIELVNSIKEEPKFVFLVVNFLALFAKFIAFKKIVPRHIFGAILIYIIFASPGLEFAAIRAGLAIGFLMIAIAYRENTFAYLASSIFALTAHFSFVVPIIFTLPKVSEYLEKRTYIFILVSAVTKLFSASLADLYPTSSDYSDNASTANAYIVPIYTFVITVLLVRSVKLESCTQANIFLTRKFVALKATIYGLISVSLGLTGDYVTAATRYLEISWCLLAILIFLPHKKFYLKLTGTLGWVLLMMYSNLNINRQTWLAIINPDIF
jgi:hypothetical protein